jgi:hypothetical protein
MSDTLGTYNFPTAGDYEIRAVIFENDGGSGGEVSARAGNVTLWDNNFKLIGDTVSGGLAIRSSSAGGGGGGSFSSVIGTNLLASMYNANPKQSCAFLRYAFNVPDIAAVGSLRMAVQYDDGFVAYLNGQEIARRNVPGGGLSYNATANSDRANGTVLQGEDIDVTAYKSALVNGGNVLAVHGVNYAANNGDFLMCPRLLNFATNAGALAYFVTPTPGALNTSAIYNRVSPVISSVPRGIYATSQNVQLTCPTPGATIYYTYDGSVPSPTNPRRRSGASPINLTIGSTRIVRTWPGKRGVIRAI